MYGKDQAGVVWTEKGLMSEGCYRDLTYWFPHLPPYESLPFFDNRDQNIVDVSE